MVLTWLKKIFPHKQFSLALHYNKNPSLTFINYSTPILKYVLVSIIASILTTTFLFRDYFSTLSTHLIGGFSGDAGIYAWLADQPLNLSDWSQSNAFYPYGKGIAWTDNYILPRILLQILQSAGAPLAESWNILFFLSNVLLGFLTFRLLFGLTQNYFISITFGVISQSLLSLTGNVGHPQLQYFFVFPLFFHCFFLYIHDRTWVRAMQLTLLVPLTFFISVYYTFFLLICGLCLFGALYLLKPHSVTDKDLKKFIAVSIFPVLLILPFLFPYSEVRNAFGERKLYEAYYFSAHPLSYFSANPFSLLYSNLSSLSHSEAHLFCGFVILFLALIGVRRIFQAKEIKNHIFAFLTFFIWGISFSLLYPQIPNALLISALFHWVALFLFLSYLSKFGKVELKYFGPQLSNRSIILIFYFLTFIFYLLSIGPLGNPEKGHLAFGPYLLFYYLIPGIDGLRAVGRYGLVVDYLLLVVAALTLWQLYSRKALSRSITFVAIGVIFLENQAGRIPHEPLPVKPPIIQSVPEGTIALSLPLVTELTKTGEVKSWTDYAIKNVFYMRWFSGTNTKIMNGYSGQKTKLMRELPREVKNFPDERSVASLKHFAGLTHILFFPGFSYQFNKSAFDTRVKETDGIKLEAVDPYGNYLFSFTGFKLVESPYQLLVHPNAKSLTLEINPRESLKFQVLSTDPVIDAPLYSSEIEANRISSINIGLPKPKNTVRPIRLLLTMDNQKDFLLGPTKVEW